MIDSDLLKQKEHPLRQCFGDVIRQYAHLRLEYCTAEEDVCVYTMVVTGLAHASDWILILRSLLHEAEHVKQ
jgi:hypothetical protein